MTAYRTPDERFADLPGYQFAPNYLEQDGLRMHYVDEGAGDPVLLFHGEPTWSFLYRKVIPVLSARGRVVAPDYFGFGRSDKPVESEWYSYDSHYASIERLVDELDLRDLTLVVHDWGGPLGLRLAVERPERVARLVITNTGPVRGPAALGRVAALPRVRPASRDGATPRAARADQLRDRGARRRRGRLTTLRTRRRSRRRASSPSRSSCRPSPTIRPSRRCSASARRSPSGRSPRW